MILLVWAGSLALTAFVEPRHYEITTAELLFYSVYDVAAGALVGFYLFDRLPKDGFALFVIRAASAILFGTLVNEALLEPFVFETGPINGEGVYYAVTETLSVAGIFLLLRLAARLYELQQRADLPGGESDEPDPACLFVKVARGTRRIHATDILYMEAERDFTRIVCANGEHFVSESLKSVLGKSGDFGIVRVHKSFAVNLGRVDRLKRTQVEIGAFRVPVGRRFRPAFVETWQAQSGRSAG